MEPGKAQLVVSWTAVDNAMGYKVQWKSGNDTARAWSPWTVRHMLRNPGYAGRTIFKRTKARRRRDPVSGKRRRIAGLNTLSSLRQGRRYWIAVMEPGIWTVAAPWPPPRAWCWRPGNGTATRA